MIKGDLSQNYTNAVASPPLIPSPGAELDERARITAFNLNTGDLARDAGVIPDGAGVIRAKEFAALKDKREEDRKRQDLMDAIRRLDEINRRLEELNQIIADVEREMRETEQLLRSTGAAIERLQAGKAPDLDENGNLRDRQLEAALREYERRHGHVDRDNSAELLVALQAIEAASQTSLQDQSRRHDDATSERDALRAERAEIEERLNQSRSAPDAGAESSRAAGFESVSANWTVDDQLTPLDGDIDDELDMFADMLTADLGGSFADEVDIVRGEAVPTDAEPASEPGDSSEPDDPITPQSPGTTPGPTG